MDGQSERDNKCERGFTLLEVLITLAIAAILLGAVIPSSFSMINNAQLAVQTHSFLGAYNTARSEAIKRGRSVHLCPRNGLECADTDQWSNGWIVFVDMNQNGNSEAEEILNVSEALPSGYQLVPNITVRQLIFYSDGQVRKINGSLPIATFRLCSPNANSDNIRNHARELVINASGRIRAQYGRVGITEC